MGYLVLSRNAREELVFIDNRTGRQIGSAMVVDAIGNVRLGFDFPDWVTILRREIARPTATGEGFECRQKMIDNPPLPDDNPG